jgi:NAD(P)-dependent dehydrogenase (short-subunit alcohol dehydrogenase family)
MSRVLIVGGYGAVGREAGRELALAGMEVVLAGRNPDRATPVPGTRLLRVDVTDGDQLAAALDGADAVLMCAEQDNARVARACFERGVHYLDVTASPEVVSQVEQLHDLAAGRGAVGVLSVGLAPGVTNLLARQVAPGPMRIGVVLGSDRFAVKVESATAGAWLTGRGQSRATGLVAALLVDRLASLPPGVRHVDELVDAAEFVSELGSYGFQAGFVASITPGSTYWTG